MKPLLALLVLGLALAFGYWKTQNPESTVGDLTTGASNGVTRITSGFSTAIAGGASTTELDGRLEERLESLETALAATQQSADPATTNARLESLEAALVTTQQSSDPSVINGRLTDAERRMVAAEEKLTQFKSDMSASLESIDTASSDRDAQTADLGSRLDLITRQIEEQSQQFNTDGIDNALTALKDDISTLQNNQDLLATEQNAKLTGMDEKLGSFSTRFNTLSADANSGNAEAVASINEQIDQRIATLEDKLDNTATEQNAKLIGMDEKLGSFSTRFNTLSTDASNGNAEAVASINAQVDQRIAALEDKLDNTNEDSLLIESMSNELSATRVKLQAMEKDVNDANALITDLTNQLASLNTQSESSSIDGQQAQLRTQLKQLQDQMNQSGGTANVTELTEALQATRDRIETLEQRVVEMPATSSAADEAAQAQSALQAQIQALESKLSEVQAAPDPNMVNTLNQVEEKVSELAAKSYVTQEELREQQQGRSIEYKIYFEPDSTEITEDAGLVLNSFIAQEKNRSVGVSIYGFTDRIGSATYNQALALQRATNVRSYLIQNGFSYTKIKSLSGLGEDAAADLPDGEENAQQRAVVLYAQQR